MPRDRNDRSTSFGRYAIGVAAVLAVLCLRKLLGPFLDEQAPLMVFLLAVMVGAWRGGLRVGLLATVLGAAAGVYFFMEPEGSLRLLGLNDQMRLALFLVEGVAISALCEKLQRQRRRAEAQAEAAEREVAERRRTEAALRESNERTRFLLDAMPQKVWTADAKGSIDYFNQPWLDYTGLPYEELRDWGWRKIVHPDDWEETARIWRSSIETGQGFQLSHRCRRADGEYRWHLSRGLALCDDDGRIKTWVGTDTDIDDQKRAEELIKESDRRKDQFLAMLGHELRNPLAGIVGAVQVLGHDRALPPTAVEMRDVISRQSGQMTRLVDDLLDISRITRGKIVLRRERLDFTALVRETTEDYRMPVESRGIALVLQSAPEPLWVPGDSTRLSQVVGNLLHNAAKFTDSGGKIIVALAREEHSKFANLSITDTGVGMTTEILADLFEPFSQADQSIDRSRGGLGLGLTLARGMISLHGGEITAVSEGEGCGSMFSIRLPLDLAEDSEAPAPDAGAAVGPLRILIIDDLPDAAFPLARLLELLGHEVVTAGDGPIGLAAARRFLPELILCDIGLPGEMDGYALARAVRAEEPLKSAYLCAVTGYGLDEDRRRALAAGFDQHLAKPVSEADLSALVANPRAAAR